jgi:hypothetical protein
VSYFQQENSFLSEHQVSAKRFFKSRNKKHSKHGSNVVVVHLMAEAINEVERTGSVEHACVQAFEHFHEIGKRNVKISSRSKQKPLHCSIFDAVLKDFFLRDLHRPGNSLFHLTDKWWFRQYFADALMIPKREGITISASVDLNPDSCCGVASVPSYVCVDDDFTSVGGIPKGYISIDSSAGEVVYQESQARREYRLGSDGDFFRKLLQRWIKTIEVPDTSNISVTRISKVVTLGEDGDRVKFKIADNVTLRWRNAMFSNDCMPEDLRYPAANAIGKITQLFYISVVGGDVRYLFAEAMPYKFVSVFDGRNHTPFICSITGNYLLQIHEKTERIIFPVGLVTSKAHLVHACMRTSYFLCEIKTETNNLSVEHDYQHNSYSFLNVRSNNSH